MDASREAAPEEPNAPLHDAPTPDRSDAAGAQDVRPALPEEPGDDATDAERDRLTALIELLGDESPAVFRAVREELLTADRLVDAPLRRATSEEDARVRARARQILSLRERQGVQRRLLGFARRRQIDLERALFLLGRLDRSDLDTRPYEKALDAMAEEVSRRIAREEDAFARPMVLSQYLGNELGFIGSEADFTHPDNIHLHRAIER